MRGKCSGFVLWPVVVVVLASVPACSPRIATEDLPTAHETIVSAGKRLGQAKPPGELTEAARKGDRVLRLLTAAERDALGRNAIRFRVDRPTIVEVAAARGFVPFWLADQGFRETGESLRNEDGDLLVFRKTFPAGLVGLGVNALDRSSPSHYAVFLKGGNGRRP